jgi:hypothetical protein
VSKLLKILTMICIKTDTLVLASEMIKKYGEVDELI